MSPRFASPDPTVEAFHRHLEEQSKRYQEWAFLVGIERMLTLQEQRDAITAAYRQRRWRRLSRMGRLFWRRVLRRLGRDRTPYWKPPSVIIIEPGYRRKDAAEPFVSPRFLLTERRHSDG